MCIWLSSSQCYNSPQPGNNGGGGAGSAFNGADGTALGGGGVGVYGAGTSGDGGPDHSKEQHGRGGSPAHNTGLNGYPGGPVSTHPGGIQDAPTNHFRQTWGTAPPQYPTYRSRQNNNVPNQSWYSDGGFPGGGGGGGNAGSSYGRGAHGIVRTVYGTVGPSAQTANKRIFPSQNVDKSDQYPAPVSPTSHHYRYIRLSKDVLICREQEKHLNFKSPLTLMVLVALMNSLLLIHQ